MPRNAFSTLARSTIVTGISDGLFSSVLAAAFYGSSVARLWQGVASVPFGPKALDGGTPYVILGLVIHFGVALAWSAVFLGLATTLRPLRRVIATTAGVVVVAMIYAPLEWSAMSLVIIPAFTHRPPAINNRWWIQFFGQIVFVGLPIVGIVARDVARQDEAR